MTGMKLYRWLEDGTLSCIKQMHLCEFRVLTLRAHITTQHSTAVRCTQFRSVSDTRYMLKTDIIYADWRCWPMTFDSNGSIQAMLFMAGNIRDRTGLECFDMFGGKKLKTGPDGTEKN